MVAASYAVSIGSEKLIGVKPAEKVNGMQVECGWAIVEAESGTLWQKSGRNWNRFRPGLRLFLIFRLVFDTQLIFDFNFAVKFDLLQVVLGANGVIARHFKQRAVRF